MKNRIEMYRLLLGMLTIWMIQIQPSYGQDRKRELPLIHYEVGMFEEAVDKTMTFDHPFEIHISASKSEVYKSKGYFKNRSAKNVGKDRNHGTFEIRQGGVSGETRIWHLEIPELKANKNYDFYIPVGLSENIMDKLHDLNFAFLKMANQANLDLDKSVLHAVFMANADLRYKYLEIFHIPEQDSVKLKKINEIGLNPFTYSGYVEFFLDQLLEYYEDISKDHENEKPGKIEKYVKLDELKTVIAIANMRDQKKLAEALVHLAKLETDTSICNLVNGFAILGESISQPQSVNTLAHEARKKNIRMNRLLLSRVLDQLEIIKQVETLDTAADNALGSTINGIKKIHSSQKAYLAKYTRIEKRMALTKDRLFGLKIIKGSTIPQKYPDFIKNFVKSEIGLLLLNSKKRYSYAGPIEGGAMLMTDSIMSRSNSISIKNLALRPHVGINIHPWPVNDDVPFRKFRLNRLFLSAGVTLGSLEDSFFVKKNGSHIFRKRQDLFDNYNFYAGMGYKAWRTINVSAGVVFARSSRIKYSMNPNDPKMLMPGSEKEVIRPWVYFSIGFHPNLGAIINGLAGVIWSR